MTSGDLITWRLPKTNTVAGGLYVHIPFCHKKCPYCHFAIKPHHTSLIAPYIDALTQEWLHRKDLLSTITTLYFGGGTPSILKEQEFEAIFSLFPTIKGEITLEANPEDVTLSKMQFYKSLGINRISLGVQSFSDLRLKAIGRGHTGEGALKAIETTRKAGFNNISIDLIYDLPNQTLEEWKETVRIGARAPISHLSLYNLVFEPGALYYKDRHALKQLMPSSTISTKMLSYAIDTLEEYGLHRYEISAFAKNGAQAEHNSSYWKALPFIGLGPSAFSYYDGARFRNSSHIAKWQSEIASGREPVDFEEKLSYPNDVHELLTVKLRMMEGADLTDYALPETTLFKIGELIAAGYLKKQENLLFLTPRGTLFYDTVAEELI